MLNQKKNKKQQKRFIKKTWIPTRLKDRCFGMEQSDHYREMKKKQIRFCRLFYNACFLKASHLEMAILFGIKRSTMQQLIKEYEKCKWLIINHDFKAINGKQTKIPGKNYYELTPLGKKKLAEFISIAFVQKPVHTQKKLSKESIYKPGEKATSKPIQVNFYAQKIKEESLSEEEKKRFVKLKHVFVKFKRHKIFSTINYGTLMNLCKFSLQQIERTLKRLKKKVEKGFKLRSFWGFFMSLLKENCSYFTRKAKIIRKDIDSGKPVSGVDYEKVVLGARAIEEKTGKVFTEKDIEKILYKKRFGIVAKAFECTAFKMGIPLIRDTQIETEKIHRFGSKEELANRQRRYKVEATKVHALTGLPYTDADHSKGENFSIIQKKIYVDEPVTKESEDTKKEKPIQNYAEIRSPIGFLINLLKQTSDIKDVIEKTLVSASKKKENAMLLSPMLSKT